MKKIAIIFILTGLSLSGFSTDKFTPIKKTEMQSLYSKNLKTTNGDCKLMEEQENGVTEIIYRYDAMNRLIEKKYVKFDYKETYKYDDNGYLIEIANNSPNPFIIEYKYENGLLISKSQKYRRLSTPKTVTYEYNNVNELIRMSEEYMSNITITEFIKGIAVKISNPHIQYDLNKHGLVIKSMCTSGPATINTYSYDSNDMLLLNEIYSAPNKKIMYKEYESSKIKKTNLGDEFVENYKGFPVYKDPFGDKGYYLSRVSNYNTNSKTGQIEKSYEKKLNLSTDGTGKIMALTPQTPSEPSRVFIYSGCSK
ncbi:hypothetical protein EGI22_02820 [Lacihabitans sp. LS3-19]|uniref:hypothetical protein n=1 Tax=Lacihabitans sp. LS3-19 TaxID=2487335 RepID=UPI0020CD94E2|nr:hypothetical protein [Lacihabitans sp. LS3-19]MCP9766825.1 hypothetical protein [Lacihabitans sp. LS3-19]